MQIHILYFSDQTPWLLFFRCSFSAATIQGWLLFKGGDYSRVATIRGWLLFKGGYYSRAATIRGRLLFEGSYYSRVVFILLVDSNNNWIGYMWAIQLSLIDAGSSTRNLSVLLSAMVMSLGPQTALEIALWASAAIICAPCIPWLLFQGSVYFAQSSWLCGYYLRVVTIQGWHLIKEIWYFSNKNLSIYSSGWGDIIPFMHTHTYTHTSIL